MRVQSSKLRVQGSGHLVGYHHNRQVLRERLLKRPEVPLNSGDDRQRTPKPVRHVAPNRRLRHPFRGNARRATDPERGGCFDIAERHSMNCDGDLSGGRRVCVSEEDRNPRYKLVLDRYGDFRGPRGQFLNFTSDRGVRLPLLLTLPN